MPDFVINGFKYGLDTRKDVLSSQPGTLVTCQNAYVNAGGEIEKRKQFGEFADCTILDDDGNQTAFGLLSAASGLLIFGHAVPNGTTGGFGMPEVATTIPTGLTYRCLAHPQLIGYDSLANYSYSRHGMQAVVFAENFNGFFFVAATFKDGNTFLYYEDDPQNQGSGIVFYRPIFHSWLGHVFEVGLHQVIFDPAIEQIGWDIGDSGLIEADSVNLRTAILSPASDYFEAVGSVESTAGMVGLLKLSQDGPSTAGDRPIAKFSIAVNSGTWTLSVAGTLLNGDTIPPVTLANAITSKASATATAAALAEHINNYTSSHGYSALSNGSSLFVYMPIAFGTPFLAELTVVTTTGATAAAGTPPTALAAVITPSPLEVVLAIPKNRATVVKGDARVEASGGAGNYKFVWREAFPGSGGGINLIQTNPGTADEKNSVASFSMSLLPNTIVKGNFICTITDAAPNEIEIPLTVSLQTTYKSGR